MKKKKEEENSYENEKEKIIKIATRMSFKTSKCENSHNIETIYL